VQKTVQLSKFDSAGVLVPIQQSGEVIEFLRPDATLLKLGVRTQPFKGELHMGTHALLRADRFLNVVVTGCKR